MTSIADAFHEAWRRFEWFYLQSEPYGGEGDGNSRLIQGERDSCSYLAAFLREALGPNSKYTIHMDFPVTINPKGQRYTDLAVIAWDEIGPIDPTKRKALCLAEFKCLLKESTGTYSIKAIEDDCKKLLALASANKDVRDLFMCIVVKRKDLLAEELKKRLENEYQNVNVLAFNG